jgi:branched-chain amino acid transport system ATP-binding protein
MTALEIRDLSVSYGGVAAVSEVSFAVAPGKLVGLIGPNGAGKTTLVDAVTGYTRSTGTVTLDGESLDGNPPHTRARRGLTRTWQLGELFEDLTVRENLSVAARPPSIRRTVRDLFRAQSDDTPIVDETLDQLGIGDLADRSAASLTEGQRKLVGVGRALVSSPRVVMLDEPAAGLDSRESEALGRTLRGLADNGLAMLLIDHDMGLVMSICDEIVVIEFGFVIATGSPQEVREHPDVIRAYLGAGSDPEKGTAS